MITTDALAALAPIRHGFLTREGGVSDGIFASLNCGFGSNDDPARVAENRARAAARIGAAPEALVTLYQVHSPTVITVETLWRPGEAPEADAMVTDRAGVALGILTADCVPVLFADAEAGVVGAAHAGWKGARGGVIAATVAAMVRLGARPENMVAAIGPCISRSSYEVGPEFPALFGPDDAAMFSPSPVRPGHFQFDLAGLVAHRLAACAIPVVERCLNDTAAEEQHFFSYRRATLHGEPGYGRGISIIALR
ncbi:MAG: peptidoglycan editing factor PgeF [Rhodospirillaceae bacterium]